MGEIRAQSVLNYWPLVVALVCLVVASPVFAGEAHEGTIQLREDFGDPEPSTPDSSGPNEAILDSGGIVGNLPRGPRKPDYDLRKLKPEDYPVEFLIPFMKTTQVFHKKVKAKTAPNVTSSMDRETGRAITAKPVTRKWTALPPETERAPRTIASSPSTEVSQEEERTETVAPTQLVSARPPVKPSKQLLDSFKASQ